MMKSFDENRTLAICDDIVEFACHYFLNTAKEAILKNGAFFVALSGGSTPKKLYNKLKEHKNSIDWGKVYLFFSDERSVSAVNIDSNFFMAMESGFKDLPIPKKQIFRMHAEDNIEQNAKAYEASISKLIKDQSFDLILLGMGDDGHTASLFPHTQALKENKALVINNHVPALNTNRMTFTYPLIEKAKHIIFLVSGLSKAEMVEKVLKDTEGKFPAGNIRSSRGKVLWILDKEASSKL